MEQSVDKEVRNAFSGGYAETPCLARRDFFANENVPLVFSEAKGKHIGCVGFAAVAAVERPHTHWVCKYARDGSVFSRYAFLNMLQELFHARASFGLIFPSLESSWNFALRVRRLRAPTRRL
jgi:hypothetical protein